FVVDGGMAAREDDALDALRHLVAHERVVDVAGVDFAVHLGFAHAAGDELGDLRAVVEDEDAVVHGGGGARKEVNPAILAGRAPLPAHTSASSALAISSSTGRCASRRRAN